MAEIDGTPSVVPNEQEAQNLLEEAKEAERAGNKEEAQFLREGAREIQGGKTKDKTVS